MAPTKKTGLTKHLSNFAFGKFIAAITAVIAIALTGASAQAETAKPSEKQPVSFKKAPPKIAVKHTQKKKKNKHKRTKKLARKTRPD